MKPLTSATGNTHALDRLFQEGAGTAEVETGEALPVIPEVGPRTERDMRFLDKEAAELVRIFQIFALH